MTDALELRAVSKAFGDIPALRDVSITVAPESITVLMGPSGCGKTTALRCIAGFERPSTGKILASGRVLSDASTFVRPETRAIGYVPQEGALFPHLSVAQNVAFGLPRLADRARRVAEVLALVGLGGFERRRPYELSGGQQQRVALARALAPRPSVVLMDEPFSALDAALRPEVCAQVTAALRAEHATAVIVTHDRDEALAIADRLIVLIDGHVQCAGTPVAIYRERHSPQVRALLGDADVLAGDRSGDVVVTAHGSFAVATPSSAMGPVEVIVRKTPVTVYQRDGSDK